MKWISAPNSSTSGGGIPASGGDELLVLFAIGAFFVVMLVRLFLGSGARSGKSRSGRSGPSRFRTGTKPPLTFPIKTSGARPAAAARRPSPAANPAAIPVDQQITAVAKAEFEKQRLLNRSEHRLMLQMEQILPRLAPGHRLMAQTSLAEVIRPKGDPEDRAWQRAFHAINAKRLDFGIFDRGGFLVCAVEYQGSGHYLDENKTFVRDAVKREALRRAGVALIEIDQNFEAEDVESALRRHFRTAQPVS